MSNLTQWRGRSEIDRFKGAAKISFYLTSMSGCANHLGLKSLFWVITGSNIELP